MFVAIQKLYLHTQFCLLDDISNVSDLNLLLFPGSDANKKLDEVDTLNTNIEGKNQLEHVLIMILVRPKIL